ncbi:MAG: glycerophosphodiester phosphodiesterase [Bacteroidota bacterium]
MFSWKSHNAHPLIVAHRGASADAPENTLAAFKKAIEQKADAIEFDVRLSNDGEVVVIHDSRLNRTTNGRGKVREKTAMELKQLSAGAWFYRKYSTERIPFLWEVLEMNNSRIGLNIEIKQNPLYPSRYDIVERCIRTVREYHAVSDVLISSFHHTFVRKAKHLEPDITTGVLYHALRGFRRKPSSLVKVNHADFFICSRRSLRKRMIYDLREHGYQIGVYTIDQPKVFRKLISAGVDIIITNNAVKLRNAGI